MFQNPHSFCLSIRKFRNISHVGVIFAYQNTANIDVTIGLVVSFIQHATYESAAVYIAEQRTALAHHRTSPPFSNQTIWQQEFLEDCDAPGG